METNRLCLDTDVIIDYLRHKPDVVMTAIINYQACVTSITVFELNMAQFLSQRQSDLLQRLYQVVPIISFDESAAYQAAQIGKRLQTKNKIIGLGDTLIAGICVANQLPLLTRNVRHFGRIQDLYIVTPDELIK